MNELPWEDGLLERKVESDLRDLLKTIVAFANSVRPGHVAVILIGERDDGSTQGVRNPGTIQQSVRKECENVYPDIIWRSAVYLKEERPCVRVEIEHSGNTPHFGGPAWVRSGSSTIKASEIIFQRLIEIRSDPVFELAKWIDKPISIGPDYGQFPPDFSSRNTRWQIETEVILKTVNRYWATFEEDLGLNNVGQPAKRLRSEPLEKLILSYDNMRQRLKVLVKL